MNILYLLQNGSDMRQPPFDGPANHVRHVIKELTALGHNVTFIIGINRTSYISTDLNQFDPIQTPYLDTGWRRLLERIIRKVQTVLHLPYAGFFESRRFAQACLQAMPNVDLVFERLSWMGYGSVFVTNKLKIPLILEYNGDPLHDLDAKHMAPKGLQRTLSKYLFRLPLKKAQLIIASGNGWKINLIEKWHIPTKKIEVVENGTELVNLIQPKDINNFSSNSIDSTKTVKIVYLGGFYAWHGTQELIIAFSRCLRSFLNIRLILIGDGPGLQQAKQFVSQLGLEQSVDFTGQIPPEDYAPILANADIGVSPYCNWVEYSGLKLFDYKAAGLAIIASGEENNPKTLVHNQTGMIIPPCDKDSLTDTLIQLLSDPEKRRFLGQNARREAENYHTWHTTGQKIHQILTKLIIQ